jgi:hypothetical protein
VNRNHCLRDHPNSLVEKISKPEASILVEMLSWRSSRPQSVDVAENRDSSCLNDLTGGGEWNRTTDLRVMSPSL